MLRIAISYCNYLHENEINKEIVYISVENSPSAFRAASVARRAHTSSVGE